MNIEYIFWKAEVNQIDLVKTKPTMIKMKLNNRNETYCHHLQHNFHSTDCITLWAKVENPNKIYFTIQKYSKHIYSLQILYNYALISFKMIVYKEISLFIKILIYLLCTCFSSPRSSVSHSNPAGREKGSWRISCLSPSTDSFVVPSILSPKKMIKNLKLQILINRNKN